MRLECPGLVRRAIADLGPHDHQRGPTGLTARVLQDAIDVIQIVPVRDVLHVPAVGGEPRAHVFGEAHGRRSREADVIVVVQDDELAEPEMPGERASLGGDALHQVAVARQHVGVVIDDRISRAVEVRRQVRLGDRHADGIRDALPERARRGFDTGSQMTLRMAGRAASPLPEALYVHERQVVAGEMQQRVEQHRAVSGRQHEAVAVGPFRIARVVL